MKTRGTYGLLQGLPVVANICSPLLPQQENLCFRAKLINARKEGYISQLPLQLDSPYDYVLTNWVYVDVLPVDFWEVPWKAFLPPFARWNVKRWLEFIVILNYEEETKC